ncbi:LysR substrate-binding domain-containing protein [Kiloniella laminariae]|uniref:LysR substrate-binding domain-containing protein n=1 Tax=Kiloniella laminariae TaxID=454162 RepID=A0ABT4LGL0_9PROT|nr:LysR substrate-binding domain-containing protein [Kiloniella laminariae]MCZ4280080.1 LysR substrate-binding domain-containing protein [Kiloniella laminariae]
MRFGKISLASLRSFEAAGRLASFTAAADELFVSQAAISKQVRELELSLGYSLFHRSHRSVTLTEKGGQLLASLTPAFDQIDGCLLNLQRQPEDTRLTLTVEPGFASGWLVHRLKDFREQYPEIEVSVESCHDLIEFRSHAADIAIRFSATVCSWPRTEVQHLFDVEMIPVVSSDLLKPAQTFLEIKDFEQLTLLHDENYNLWKQWFDKAGIVVDSIIKGPIFDDSGLILQAVLDRQGAALVDTIQAKKYLVSGQIQQIFPVSLQHGSYWLAVRKFETLSKAGKIFVAWLSDAVRRD